MSVKCVVHPKTQKRYCLGCNPPLPRGLKLHLNNYVLPDLPAPQTAVDWSPSSLAALAEVYLNDSEGDCVIAGNGHVEGVLTGNATRGAPVLFSDTQINALYSAIGGYVPGDPATDVGCDPETALNYLKHQGFLPGASDPRKIAGWLALDGADITQIQQAIYLFENVGFAVYLPDAWIDPPPSESGFVWAVNGAPDTANGHYFIGFGYNGQGIQISTWGMVGTLTYAACETYPTMVDDGAVYTLISHDALNRAKQKAPNGLDWAQLEADFAAMGAAL